MSGPCHGFRSTRTLQYVNGFAHGAQDRDLLVAFNSFFAGCHLFIPLFDPVYDTYESLMERSPWTFDAILAVAGKIRSGNGPLSPTFYKCLEEAQGIARSSLFGPVVRKEAVQGMLLSRLSLFILSWFVLSMTTFYHNRNAITGRVEYQRLATQWACYENGP